MIDAISKATGIAIPAYAVPDASPSQRWARSGLSALTGPRISEPVKPTRDYCGRIDELAHGVEAFARAAGMNVRVDGSVINERAAWLGLQRNGSTSANG